MISKTSITSFLHCELCHNHITILPIWIEDPLHCSGMIEVWPLRAKRCPRPREHQLLSSFFQFLRPPPLSKLPPIPHLLLLPSLLCLSSFFAPPALSQQFTSSVSQTVTFAFCPGARKRAPRCHHALCFVCSYFKSHNSHNLLSLSCVRPVFVLF